MSQGAITCLLENRSTGGRVVAPQPSLKQLAIRGAVWTVAGYGASQILRLGGNLVLTRLLFPEAFGLMALVGVFMQGLAMFSDVGIGPAIIQSRRGEDPEFLNTAWTLQIIRGFVLWLISCLIAWPVAVLYGEPMLVQLLPVAGISAFLAGFNSTAVYTLNRRLALGQLTVLQLMTQAATVILVIPLAWHWRSVWALLIGWLFAAAIHTALTYRLPGGHRHRLCLDCGASKSLLRFGRWVFVSTLLTFLGSQMDRLLMGWYVPPGILGIYSIAIGLTALPREVAVRVCGAVLFPLLARGAERDMRHVSATLLRSRRMILSLGLAASLVVVVASPCFFHRLYDARYHDAGWMAQLSAVSCWFAMLQMSADRLLLAVGNSRALAMSNACRLVWGAIGCITGFQIAGTGGFLLGIAVGALAGHCWVQWELARMGVLIIAQDLRYTLSLALLSAAALLGPAAWTALFGPLKQSVAVLGMPIAVIVPTCLWAGARIKREVFG